MKEDEYLQYDALGIAELIRSKSISPEEVLSTAIARLERLNPSLNAVITTTYDLANAAIKTGLPNGPFRGVPFLLKDLGPYLAGVRMTHGSKAFRSFIPIEDGPLVSLYKAAGLVIMGKTNTPEFGLKAITEPELHGPARNPFNLEVTPGGSSGGSAAAVAAGLTPIASAGDGGGSIRIPAAYCGLIGLKPSRGRVSSGPLGFEPWQGAVCNHILSRSVRDSAAMLDATSTAQFGEKNQLKREAEPYLTLIEQIEQLEKPRRLKIGYTLTSFIDTPVDRECSAAVEATLSKLQTLGHEVAEVKPPINGHRIAEAYLTMYYGETAADLAALEEHLGRKPRCSDVELTTWLLGLMGQAISAEQFVIQKRLWAEFSVTMHHFHQQYDLLLTPTTAQPPARIGSLNLKSYEVAVLKCLLKTGKAKSILSATGLLKKVAYKNLMKTPFTQLANLTGQPAISLPTYKTSDGQPLGSQFIAPMGDEATLLQLARQLENLDGGWNRVAPLAGL